MTVRCTVRGPNLTGDAGSSRDPATERARLLAFIRAYARLCARVEMAAADRPDAPNPLSEPPDAASR
jgi:hypothetical protein